MSTIQAYDMLETDRPDITVRRRSTGWEGETIAGPDAELAFPEIEVTIPLSAIYARYPRGAASAPAGTHVLPFRAIAVLQ